MSNGTTPERCQPPRPLILTLPAACKTAVKSGTILAEMNLSIWAQSYNCLETDVVEEFEKQLWIATQQPVGFDEGSEGK